MKENSLTVTASFTLDKRYFPLSFLLVAANKAVVSAWLDKETIKRKLHFLCTEYVCTSKGFSENLSNLRCVGNFITVGM